MSEKDTHCYVGTMPGCGCIGIVCVDMKDMPKETAKSLAEMARAGLEVNRLDMDQWAELIKTAGMGCARKYKMKNCKAKGLNLPGTKPEVEDDLLAGAAA
jgi:hypothetical protein